MTLCDKSTFFVINEVIYVIEKAFFAFKSRNWLYEIHKAKLLRKGKIGRLIILFAPILENQYKKAEFDTLGFIFKK